jgi:STIP1 family protein 1
MVDVPQYTAAKLLPILYYGEQALNLLKSSNSVDKMAEDIWQVLAKAKYLHWEKHSTERVWKMQSLR